MSDQPKNDNKTSTSVPFVPIRRGNNRSKIKEAIDKKEHLRQDVYVDGHKQVETYQKAFAKKGHNILQNMKNSDKKSRRKK